MNRPQPGRCRGRPAGSGADSRKRRRRSACPSRRLKAALMAHAAALPLSDADTPAGFVSARAVYEAFDAHAFRVIAGAFRVGVTLDVVFAAIRHRNADQRMDAMARSRDMWETHVRDRVRQRRKAPGTASARALKARINGPFTAGAPPRRRGSDGRCPPAARRTRRPCRRQRTRGW